VPRKRKVRKPVAVEATTHRAAKRLNIPTAEDESIVPDDDRQPRPVSYPRRNRDLDPQLMWRGKDEQDWSDLVVPAPPLYIQEKVEPKALVDDLLRETKARRDEQNPPQPSLFGDFNGLPEGAERTEFYQHQGNWSNRMILGDSLRVMASLAEREGLRGKVQCIYFDPPYGIKFNSNFQWSTTSRDVKDGKQEHISREPEQVKAFRDTWRDGIHSYLTYLRDRLTVARDLLTESGSIFVQIGDENVHRVRALMDEVFGPENFVAAIAFATTTSQTSRFLPSVFDSLLWFAKDRGQCKARSLLGEKDMRSARESAFALFEANHVVSRRPTGLPDERLLVYDNLTARSGPGGESKALEIFGVRKHLLTGSWKTSPVGLARLGRAGRIGERGDGVFYKRYFLDFPCFPLNNMWRDTQSGGIGRESKAYVVQTNPTVIARCILMTTEPGDLVLDPTCGSGTTAYVAEQWGRRWITIDTSRVALALARSRIMGARYPFYTLSDSAEGQQAEAKLAGTEPRGHPTYGDIRHGFVYQRVPHITLKAIANNTEIDSIWERRQPAVEAALIELNEALSGHPTPFPVTRGARKRETVDFTVPTKSVELPNGDLAPVNGLLEWEVPRDAPNDWPAPARSALNAFWDARIIRQSEIDTSIDRKADFEHLYDKPVEDRTKVRVAGPFTVESLAPHRTLSVDEQDELIPHAAQPRASYGAGQHGDFTSTVLENLRAAGVQQAHREDRIEFSSLSPWPGEYIAAEGRYAEGERERRAGILIGPEFGTVARSDLVGAAREAADAGFDVLVSCAFAYDAHASELPKLGKVPILKARMNADLHMGEDLKTTGKGNLFVIFGEPDIEIEPVGDDEIRVRLRGVDVFHPQTGEVRSDSADGIACWFLDTGYNGESFFVRHAYFPGASTDPYKALKTTLKAEIDQEAWESLRRDVSRPFLKPASGRIAVKVINHLGDEVMKVFRV
jgi:adenine-specific DNA-methyltransferase